jgi:hypothetical protein
VQSYVGIRASASRVSGDGDSSTVFRFSGALGAEYLPVEWVALGVEGRLGFVTSDGDDAAAFSSGQAFVRVFLR